MNVPFFVLHSPERHELAIAAVRSTRNNSGRPVFVSRFAGQCLAAARVVWTIRSSHGISDCCHRVSFPGEEEFMRFLRRLPARQPVSTRSRLVLSGLEERAVPATFTVDDSITPNPAERRFNTIQAAVTAADLTPEDDIIRVGPGTYREAVVVPATEPGLTILGAFSGQDAAQRSRDTPRPSRDSIVDPPAGASAFTLNADRVVVDGFTVRGATGKAGITTSKAA